MWNKEEKKEKYHSWDEYIKHLDNRKSFGIPGLEDKIKKEKIKDKFLKDLSEKQFC